MAAERTAAHPGPGWPFWAPSADDTVARALDLGAVRPGETFVDLGCGDGRVLVAAAARGARVTGVECDSDLAARARARLAGAGVGGEILETDIFELDLDADVVFTYLSPATLQRLAPALNGLRAGARAVTVDFAMPGVVADGSADRAHLYVAPFRRERPAAPGWRSAGVLVVAVAGYESLTCLDPGHPGGDVTVALRGGVRRTATVATGADRLARGERLAVDLRWGEHEAGTVSWGGVEVAGLPPLPVFVLFSDDHGGVWELSEEACDRLADHLATHLTTGGPPPTADELVATAMGDD